MFKFSAALPRTWEDRIMMKRFAVLMLALVLACACVTGLADTLKVLSLIHI